MIEKQVAIKVFGDDERCHYYFYREPDPRHPNSADVTEECP